MMVELWASDLASWWRWGRCDRHYPTAFHNQSWRTDTVPTLWAECLYKTLLFVPVPAFIYDFGRMIKGLNMVIAAYTSHISCKWLEGRISKEVHILNAYCNKSTFQRAGAQPSEGYILIYPAGRATAWRRCLAAVLCRCRRCMEALGCRLRSKIISGIP